MSSNSWLTFSFTFSFHYLYLADIVDTAVSAGNFKTLAAALGAAGLVDTLKSKGPFTVSLKRNLNIWTPDRCI